MSDSPSFRVVPGQGQSTLCLEGNVGAAQALALQAALRTELESDHACVLDWSQAQHVDGCVLQLLYAWASAVRARGRGLSQTFAAGGPPAFLAQSGMERVFARLTERVDGRNA